MPPLDRPTQEAIDVLSDLLVKGINGAIEIGFADGMKLNNALKVVVKSQAAPEVMAQIWSKFWNTNPRAAASIEMAASLNPQLATFFQKMKMAAKPADAETKS